MNLEMKDKVALVTGAAGGIGQATAIMFAEEGARVVVADVKGGEETVGKIREQGGEAIYTKTDVSSEESVKDMIAQTIGAFGRLDFAVNGAAVEGMKLFMDQTTEDWDRQIDTNLKGTWLCMKYQIKEMLKIGGGAIVNIASGAGLRAHPQMAPYVASKFGVNGITKSAGLEFIKQGVRVNCVCPGSFDTPMVRQAMAYNPKNAERAIRTHPIGRIGQPEECAYAIVMLCSPKASFINCSTLAVDSGATQY